MGGKNSKRYSYIYDSSSTNLFLNEKLKFRTREYLLQYIWGTLDLLVFKVLTKVPYRNFEFYFFF